MTVILANKTAPALLDHYLAHFGYTSQKTPELADRSRPDNLWKAVPGDHGVHGPFSNQATRHSPQGRATLHRSTPTLAAGLGLALVGSL